jgi:peptidoglycan-associated lipoprotein
MNGSFVAAGAALFVALATSACGSTPKAGPTSPASLAAGTPAASAAASPEAGEVRVDDAIAKACNLPTPEFAFDSSRVDADAANPLDAVATCFASGPLKGKTLRLTGHTDPRGETEYNLALGQRRAGAVAHYVEGKGVSPGQVQTSSRGELDATGTDESGWAHDRRVDMQLAN